MGDEIVRPNTGELARHVAAARDSLTDEVIKDFEHRGDLAWYVASAALTETPGFVAKVGGREYRLEPLPSYDGGDSNAAVEEAKLTLAGYVQAEVPGTKGVKLDKYATRYPKMLGLVLPGRRDEPEYVAAFDENLMDSARRAGVTLNRPEDVKAIVKQAPNAVRGLRLSDHRGGISEEHHTLVTEGGHALTVTSGRYPYSTSRVYYDLSTDTDDFRYRGGKVPSELLLKGIGQRITDLRTKESKR